MKTRKLYKAFQEGLRSYPIVVLTGPRQSGKSTFLRSELSEYRYVSLEDIDIRTLALEDPRGFLEEYEDKVILDEVQNVPSLFSYIQTKTDQDRIMGQYVLSGSQNFSLLEKITQSLAGRVSIFTMMPFDIGEMRKAEWLGDDLGQIITTGFYPAIFERKANHDKYYANYLDTYVNRDVSQLKNIQNKTIFKNFVKLCAIRSGQLINYNDLSRDAGVSHTTTREWLSILEASYIVYTLSPYYNNYSKRLVKSPKLYFYDVGLLCHLLGIRDGNLSQEHTMWGNIFENFIVTEHVKINYHRDLLKEYYFWRDSNGIEVDLLELDNQQMTISEIKAGKTVRTDMFKNLDKFEKFSGLKNLTKQLVYGGDQDQKRTHYRVKSWRSLFI